MDSLKAHWAYLLNCSQSLILDHGYWTSEGEKDPKDVVMVRLSNLLLKSLDQIGSCRALRICILADNFLTRIEALMACTHLVKLDLKGNQVFTSFNWTLNICFTLKFTNNHLCAQIVQLPDASYWSHLKELQLLYLHDNNMSAWNNIKGLSGCLNLTALTLYDTPLSLKKNYRHCLVNNIWSLKALDNFVISDEEIIQNWSLPFQFKAMKQHFCVNLYPSTKPVGAHYCLFSLLCLLLCPNHILMFSFSSEFIWDRDESGVQDNQWNKPDPGRLFSYTYYTALDPRPFNQKKSWVNMLCWYLDICYATFYASL